MKVQLKDGIVVCSLEEKNHDFLYDCYGLFDGYYGFGYLKMAKTDIQSDEECVIDETETLKSIIFYADKHGIAVDDNVRDMLLDCETAVAIINQKRLLQKQEYEKRENWQRLSKNGCLGCQYIRRWNDDFICWKTKDLLDEKNIPSNGYLFNYVPFPSQNCPYKAEPIDEADETYIAYKRRELLNEF